MIKPCRFCEKNVPADCTGEIQDHCTWCGGPVAASDKPLDADRFCNDKCLKENTEWDIFFVEQTLKVGDIFKAVVFATAPYGIYLRDVNHPKVDILVHATQVSWGSIISPNDYTQPGAVLEIKILSTPDKLTATATIVGEEIVKK